MNDLTEREKATEAIVAWIVALESDIERREVIRSIEQEVCFDCGGLDGIRCTCMRDE